MVKTCRPRNKLSRSLQILVTGASGFIGKNLIIRLSELPNIKTLCFTRKNNADELLRLVAEADVIFHMAGVNRPSNPDEFDHVNSGLTEVLCNAIRAAGRNIPLVFASSIQAELGNPYGKSKRAAESTLESLSRQTNNDIFIYRLPGVFGKWCRPNYNSVVATFCYSIARDLPIRVDNPDAVIELAYIDEVIDEFLSVIHQEKVGLNVASIKKTYSISVGKLAQQIYAFKESRANLMTERVGAGLIRALYSTYISYLPPENFFYDLPIYGDDRGIFVEMLKTPDCGQLSFFTVHSGITRGSHYHHSKSEKFLIVKGIALMKFRNLSTGEIYEVTVSADKPRIVESIPGWVHDISNVGKEEAIIMLWANEVYDREYPDCVPCKV